MLFRSVQEFHRGRLIGFSINRYGAAPIADCAGRVVTEKNVAPATGIGATPNLVFYGLEGSEIVRLAHAIRDPNRFNVFGEFAASNVYRAPMFSEFPQAYRHRKGS